MACILVVDDDEILLSTLDHLPTIAGHDSDTADDDIKADRHLSASSFDHIRTIIVIPNRDGIETAITPHREFQNISTIGMSGDVKRYPLYLLLPHALARSALSNNFSLRPRLKRPSRPSSAGFALKTSPRRLRGGA